MGKIVHLPNLDYEYLDTANTKRKNRYPLSFSLTILPRHRRCSIIWVIVDFRVGIRKLMLWLFLVFDSLLSYIVRLCAIT